jgi:uncharacterized membrane protein
MCSGLSIEERYLQCLCLQTPVIVIHRTFFVIARTNHHNHLFHNCCFVIMAQLYSILLFLHIGTGMLCLAFGLVASVSAKGGKIHRRSGMLYTYLMGIVAVSAIVMSNLKWNPFLLSIGVFSGYLTLSGVRVLARKKEHDPVSVFDKAYTAITLGIALWMLWMSMNNIVLGVFGTICLLGVIEDIFAMRGKYRYDFRTFRIVSHLGRMLGSYIAVWTAFVVTNVPRYIGHVEPWWLLWLAPTIVLAPVIAYYRRKYTRTRTVPTQMA